MKKEEKIVFPKEVQREMLKFFLNTSMPRIKKAKEQEEKDKSTIKNKK